MTFAREAVPFVAPPTLLALAAFFASWLWAGAALVALAALLLLFFRMPRRQSDAGKNQVIAAADGVVLGVDTVDEKDVADAPCSRIKTFLSVFNVHVQRAPVAGRVVHVSRQKGPKHAAYQAAAEANEQHLTVIETEAGDRVGVRQIAGLVARRIVTYVEPGDELRRGELLGLIKFGSRVDVILPSSYEVCVARGQRLRDGETLIATSNSGPVR